MILKRLPDGMFSSNAYIVGDQGEAVVIDTGVRCEDLIQSAEKAGLKIKHIILTHAHIDHILSADELREKTGATVMIHELDAPNLSNALYNGSVLIGRNKVYQPADVLLKDGSIIEAGGLTFEVMHTPGHTQGCICIKVDHYVFTGDTLFQRSIGRTDLPNGDSKQIITSIKSKLMTLDQNLIVYPGHGASTTIGEEKKHNPFLIYERD